jgi:hypothetical protein
MSVNKFGAGLKSVGGTNKSYVDNKLKTLMVSKVNKVGDELSGDLNILLNEDKLRSFGVTDINPGKSVSLLLGDINNQIRLRASNKNCCIAWHKGNMSWGRSLSVGIPN